MDKDLVDKLKGERLLTVDEALRLDCALEDQRSVRASLLVADMPDEAPSLAWRSSLNQKLSKASRRRRASTLRRFGVAASAVAAASLLVVSFFPQVSRQESTGPRIVEHSAQTLEDTLLAEHQDSAGQASLGIHVSFDETGS